MPDCAANWVAGQAAHEEEPGEAAKRPGGQSLQVLRAPSLNFPAGQTKQLPCPVGEKSPGAQGMQLV